MATVYKSNLSTTRYRCRSFEEDYSIISAIGHKGLFTNVYRVKSNSVENFTCAVKIIDKNKIQNIQNCEIKTSYIKALENETKILKQLNHPFIINMHDVYETDTKIYILMEECKGGELFDKIMEQKQFKEAQAKHIMHMICSALFYLHSQHNIVYCDLKPDNILFKDASDGSDIKLIDFGMAQHKSPFDYCHELCGTPYYTAPEVIDNKYSHSADMWSLGVLMFCILFGFPPFYVEDEAENRNMETYRIYKLIKKGFDAQIKSGYGAWFPRDMIESEKISDECMDFMAKLLTINVEKRLTAKEALQHEWFNGSVANLDLFGLSLIHFTVVNPMKYHMTNLYKETYERLRPKYVDNLRNLFKIWSDNKDTITYQQFECGMIKCMQSKLQFKSTEIREIFDTMDTYNCGYIEFDPFLAVAIYDHLLFHNKRLFKVYCLAKNNDDLDIINDELSYGAFLNAVHSDLETNNCKVIESG